VQHKVVDEAFRSGIQELACRTNCPTFDSDLWESAFTHASFRREDDFDDRSAEQLIEIVERIGAEALRTSTYEYCLDQKGMDRAETSLAFNAGGSILLALLHDFQLVRVCRVGKKVDGLDANKSLQLALAERFLGLIIISSSYRNVRQLIWDRIESTLFSPSELVFYDMLDPRTWLQQYCDRFYDGKYPSYQLIDTIGPEHKRIFRCRVVLPDKRLAEATGSSLKAAKQQAAVTIIDSLQLTKRMSIRSKPPAEAMIPPCLNVRPNKIDRYLMRAAFDVAQKLRYKGIDRHHLAVALTLPARGQARRGIETNLRHKLLGDALETLAFALFAFQSIPIRAFGSSNISKFIVAICSNSQHAPLFDRLELEPIVCHEPEVQLSEQGKSEVIKAIAAAAYLSTRDFSQFFAWITANLGKWCQETVTLLAENPLAVKEPKSFLQELLQAQESYKTEYVDQRSGPEHKQTFSTTLFLSCIGQRVKLGHGTGSTLKEAQQVASTRALESIVPRNVAGVLAPIATRFWKSYFDRLLGGEPGVIVAACGVEHFKTLNSFTGFFGLKAFSASLPELSCYLQKPEFLEVVLKSIGRLAITSPRQVLSLGKQGIALITDHSPDDVKAFAAPEVDGWLTKFRRASAGLKLPTSEIRCPLGLIPISELGYVRDWKLSILEGDSALSISEPMFSHVVTLLELLGRDVQDGCNELSIIVEAAPDWRLLKLMLNKTRWTRLQIEEVADQLLPNAFFSGVSDAIREGSSNLTLEIKGVYFQTEEPHIKAYTEIMRRLYHAQDSLQSLHRIVHDLKNQVIAIRTYATRAMTEPQTKYQMFAAIEQLQEQIRDREAALTLFFRAADESSFTNVNLKQTIRAFFVKQMPSLPENIRPEFVENLDTSQVIASKELLTSLLDNLTLNAIEAMPKGGVLSISAAYRANDSMLEINVSDTGVGISPESLPELFTSLKSTKAKGMGLGLAGVKRIVEQHDGLIDVESRLGAGTKFTVLLPLRRESEVLHAGTDS